MNKNIIMGPAGPKSKNDWAGEGQKQITAHLRTVVSQESAVAVSG
jgi:hypothetical protein